MIGHFLRPSFLESRLVAGRLNNFSGAVRIAAAIVLIAVCTGTACALFLWLLDLVTAFRHRYPELVWFLPFAGILSGWMYFRWGSQVEAGNNLILEQIHQPTSGIPLRMAPMVLAGTLITHLFGGSAGREGTAVQMGGSFASQIGRWLKLKRSSEQTLLLKAGIAAGFAGVFGTPIAGAVFALEVLATGQIQTASLAMCLVAAFISDRTCLLWGIGHTQYSITSGLPGSLAGLSTLSTATTLKLALSISLAAVVFGLTSRLFCITTHQIARWSVRFISRPWLRPMAGGVIILTLMLAVGSRDYLGLGVDSADDRAVTIVSSFRPDGAYPFSWLWKLLFTAITVGSGFKGGEVTPLFFIGALMGNAIANLNGLPVDLLAGLGFVSVFAAATKTPITCTLMSAELFGGEYTLWFAISCTIATQISGPEGIYRSQRRVSVG